MPESVKKMRESSPAFRQALLKSEKKRIVGVIACVPFFTLYDSVLNFSQGTPQNDDLTAVIIKKQAA